MVCIPVKVSLGEVPRAIVRLGLPVIVSYCRVILEWGQRSGECTWSDPVLNIGDPLGYNSGSIVDEARIDDLKVEETLILDNNFFICGWVGCVDNLDPYDEVVLEDYLFTIWVFAIQDVIFAEHWRLPLHA